MIKYTDDKTAIVVLWKDAFGDSEEEINYFIDNVKQADCLMRFEDGEPVSMMYLVDCCVRGEKVKYIYAACTLGTKRGSGYMSELIEYCINNDIKVCLIPANDSLIDYYSKRGINKRISISDIGFQQIPEIEEYLFEGYNLSEPFALMS